MEHLLNYLHKTVRIRCKDGHVATGHVCSYSNAIDEDLDCDELSLERDGWNAVFEQDYIESIEIMPEK